ncbi:N-acetyltransferase [Leptotrichia sp.]|uniref:GNAT family N-acetyltransferase n=1 Tax=Leptotrichia sp. TaxID=104608 RepID=UPI001826C09D|nr:N-acetyltransferase [Leptotrichia sp.]MBB1534791.1 GNAT family N-acetyltransferase [Leptotrichia sp.]
MEEKVIMRELHAKKDEKILFDIVEHENKVFGDASIGNWNVKPFAKYGKIYVTLIQDENQNEKIVSVVEVLSSFNRDKAYIYGVFTVPEFQGKKYATKLLKFVLENLEKLGIKNIELTVEVDNERAQRLYRNLGFEVVEELENEYRDNSRRYLMGVYLEK